MQRVLQLDVSGTPQAWVTMETAASHYASGTVAWEFGDSPLAVFRGGWNVPTGRQSEIVISPIIALRGKANRNLFETPGAVTKEKLLLRDRMTCAYCGEVFAAEDLEAEHIVPESRQGPYDWMNLVCADRWCNAKKGARTPQEAGMELLYLPYIPNRWEQFLLSGRNIRQDVHVWLASRLAKGSRLN
jgi:hypothetical protein